MYHGRLHSVSTSRLLQLLHLQGRSSYPDLHSPGAPERPFPYTVWRLHAPLQLSLRKEQSGGKHTRSEQAKAHWQTNHNGTSKLHDAQNLNVHSLRVVWSEPCSVLLFCQSHPLFYSSGSANNSLQEYTLVDLRTMFLFLVQNVPPIQHRENDAGYNACASIGVNPRVLSTIRTSLL